MFKKTTVYNDSKLESVSKDYLYDNIKIYSPIISQNVDAIFTMRQLSTLERALNPEEQSNLDNAKNILAERNINHKQYLEDLAKVNLFINKNVHCHNPALKEMLIESAFASYLYQKDNNLPYSDFDEFFSTAKEHPFNTFKKLSLNHIYFFGDKGDGVASFIAPTIALNKQVPDLCFDEYCLATIKIITHELQHKISGLGTCSKDESYNLPYKESFNEMCTEWHTTQITGTYIDSSSLERTDVILTSQKGQTKMKLNSYARVYKESVALYETINEICSTEISTEDGIKKLYLLSNIYYDRDKNLENALPPEIKKLLPEIYDSVMAADKGLFQNVRNYNYRNHTYSKDAFNSLIESYSKLCSKYLTDVIGLSKNSNSSIKDDAIKFIKADSFLKTINIGMEIKGDNYKQSKLIKEKVLGSIVNSDISSTAAIERIKNNNLLFNDFSKKCTESELTIGTSDFAKLHSKFNSITALKDESLEKDKVIHKTQNLSIEPEL